MNNVILAPSLANAVTVTLMMLTGLAAIGFVVTLLSERPDEKPEE